MTRFVDHVAEGTAVGRCVVLPGSRYTPDGPLLFFATQVALMRGWDVRQVWWEPPAFDGDAAELAWVGAQLGRPSRTATDGSSSWRSRSGLWRRPSPRPDDTTPPG